MLRALLNSKPSVSAMRADIHAVNGERAGVLGPPVSEEELLGLALQSLLAFSDFWARLVHNQAHTSSVSEVVLWPVGRPYGNKRSSGR